MQLWRSIDSALRGGSVGPGEAKAVLQGKDRDLSSWPGFDEAAMKLYWAPVATRDRWSIPVSNRTDQCHPALPALSWLLPIAAIILPPGYPAYIGVYITLVAALLALPSYGWRERAAFSHPT